MRPGDATLEPQSKDKGILVRIGELIVGWCCVALDRVSVFVCLCCVSVALLNETDRFPKTPEDGWQVKVLEGKDPKLMVDQTKM